MIGAVLSVGFIPLVDAAPLIVSQEMGFAAQEGLAVNRLCRTNRDVSGLPLSRDGFILRAL
ncbi:ABC transporter substrate-binding protein [Alisedimentitalea sp. MJ-SS2]|uniref:ABC transporter substrate-binding protein n=1 Tax=Aliisedimentitalea sp. MJ-SS2 TaxID=3049795 RepID=UPI0029093B9A|nr:ABC transporter substrate-binding protein [Alisedimentitalea sp. MJ-SS2]